MNAWFGALAMVAAMTAGLQPAAAEPVGFALRLQGQQQSREPVQRDPRDLRREQRLTPERDQRQPSKLTDEQRRELRRDIDQANRDIYRQQRR